MLCQAPHCRQDHGRWGGALLRQSEVRFQGGHRCMFGCLDTHGMVYLPRFWQELVVNVGRHTIPWVFGDVMFFFVVLWGSLIYNWGGVFLRVGVWHPLLFSNEPVGLIYVCQWFLWLYVFVYIYSYINYIIYIYIWIWLNICIYIMYIYIYLIPYEFAILSMCLGSRAGDTCHNWGRPWQTKLYPEVDTEMPEERSQAIFCHRSQAGNSLDNLFS